MNNSYIFPAMLGVCGTNLVSPGWLVLGVSVGTCEVQTTTTVTKMSFQVFLGRPTHLGPFDLTKHHDFVQSSVLRSRVMTKPREPSALQLGGHGTHATHRQHVYIRCAIHVRQTTDASGSS